jgi:uncharacterized protein (DUF1015 family)
MNDIIFPLSIESKDKIQRSYLLCEIISKTERSLGVLAFVGMDSISQKRILTNEKTYPGKQKQILNSFLCEQIQKKPVLLTYDKQDLDLAMVKHHKPSQIYFFGGIIYRLWEIQEQDQVQKLSRAMNGIEQFIVADGHHRIAALTQYYQNKASVSDRPCFLAFLTEKSQIVLRGFNKLLTRIDMPFQSLLDSMTPYFDVDKVNALDLVKMDKPAIYLNNSWFNFSLKNQLKTSANFDIPACYVQGFLFEKILGINNDTMEEKVFAISQITPMEALEQLVNNGIYSAAVYIPPVKETEFIYHVKSDCLFPQNSTFFSPKITHDLFVFFMQKQKMILDLQLSEIVA